jgi:hypothetical protein
MLENFIFDNWNKRKIKFSNNTVHLPLLATYLERVKIRSFQVAGWGDVHHLKQDVRLNNI